MKKRSKKPPLTAAELEHEIELISQVLLAEIHNPKPKKLKAQADGTFDWRTRLAELIKDPPLGSQLLSEWTRILGQDPAAVSDLIVRLLIAAESAANWERRAGIAEAELNVANKELSKRWKRESEIALRVWREQREYRKRTERILEMQVRFWRNKAEGQAEKLTAKSKAAEST